MKQLKSLQGQVGVSSHQFDTAWMFLFMQGIDFVLIFIFLSINSDITYRAYERYICITTKASLFTVVIHCCGSPITITLNGVGI